MRTAASPARPDHDTPRCGSAAARTRHRVSAFCVALAAYCAGMTALAQNETPCTAITDDAERLACYDKALRPPAAAPAAPPTPAARAPEPAARAAASDVATPPQANDRRRQRRVRESSAPAPAAAPVAPAAPRAGAAVDEQVVAVVVVGMRALPGREATFTTEDGGAWLQIDSQRLVGLPDPPFAAELRPGAMGSYFLVPTERGRAVRVRPVR